VALHALSETVAPPETTEVLRKIGVVKRGRRLRRTILGVVVLAAIAAAVLWWSRRGAAEAAPIWEAVTVDRADIEVQVVATGSLEARSVVAVGAEMSGRVASVAVDVNQRVTKGQVLVHLDPETAANTLAEAQATLKSSTADLNRSRAALAEAKSVEKRVISLAERGLVSAEEQNTQITSVTLAEADVARSSAQIKLAKIRVDQAKTNLEKLVIVSPIDGIVLSRTVEPGTRSRRRSPRPSCSRSPRIWPGWSSTCPSTRRTSAACAMGSARPSASTRGPIGCSRPRCSRSRSRP
jgi:HlyD family secretion protein